MKNVEMLKKEFSSYCTLYDMIECRIAEIAKENGWLVVNDVRYLHAMEQIAKEWDANLEELLEYYAD